MDVEMTNRRKFLKGVSAGIASLFLTSAVSSVSARKRRVVQHVTNSHPTGKFDRDQLVGQSQLPEALVETHDGQVIRLYDDLIKGKVVTINFMSTRHESAFPISSKLLQVAQRLGDRVGREVRMISITHDPAHDTPERLREFAKAIGAPAGWHFVRTTGEGHAMLLARLYHHGRRNPVNVQMDMVQYGNATVGLWGAFPSDVDADDAAMRITSVMSGQSVGGPIRQAGPRRLGDPGPTFTNRVA